MKYTRVLIVIILIVSIIPFLHIIFSPDLPHTSDGEVQLPRMAAYYKALADGHFPVRWAGDINYGFGLPVFNFMYPLPYLLSSLLIFLNLSLVQTFKVELLLSFLLSGVFMYLFARELFGNDLKAFLVTIFYQFAPYHLEEILMRGALGSIFIYAFFPMTLFYILKYFKTPNFKSGILIAFSSALMIISHNSLSLMFFGLTLLFTLYFGQNNHTRFKSILFLFLGIGLSCWYWLPAVFENKFTYGSYYMQDMYKNHFRPLLPLFTQQLALPGNHDWAALRLTEINVHIGILNGMALILAFLFFAANKIKADKLLNKTVIFALIISFITIFMTQKPSSVIWDNLKALHQFQFPWRLLTIIVFTSSISSVVFLIFIKKSHIIKFILLITSTIILSSIYFWYPPYGYDKILDESKIWNYPLSTTYYGETDVIWSEGQAKNYPKSPIEIIGGNAEIFDFKRKNHYRTYTVNAKNDIQILDNTVYFPGWKVLADKTQIPIEFQDPNHRGLITYRLPKGIYMVKVVFGESKIRLIGDGISIVSATIIFIFILKLILAIYLSDNSKLKTQSSK